MEKDGTSTGGFTLVPSVVSNGLVLLLVRVACESNLERTVFSHLRFNNYMDHQVDASVDQMNRYTQAEINKHP